jgi:ribonuclease HI
MVEIYTDGSCHTQYRVGAWVAILLLGEEKKILTGAALDTTHNRMELSAAIEAIEYVKTNYSKHGNLKIYSDSEYVTGLPARKEKLKGMFFAGKMGKPIQNADLVKLLLEKLAIFPVEFIKVKAHQKKNATLNYNIEADKLCRKIVRSAAKEKLI